MARLAGINIPDNKQTGISLTYIYGIGRRVARDLCDATGLDPISKVGDLSEKDLESLRSEIAKLVVEGDLRRAEQLNIKRLLDLGCYRGIRHRRNLPVNGQRSKTNARTRKGPKRPIRK